MRANGDRFLRDLDEYDGDLEAAIDTGDIAEIINRLWHDVFASQFPKSQDVRSTVRLIRNARNEAAHWRTKNDMDAENVRARLTDIANVLRLISKPDEQREVEKIRDRLADKFTNHQAPTTQQPELPAASESNVLVLPDDTKPMSLRGAPTDPPLQADRSGAPERTHGSSAIDAERGALIALYQATDGPHWINSHNWTTEAPIDDWHGVSTDSRGRVAEVDLSRNGLRGEIPAEMIHLANLEWLDLSANQLYGEIPAELGHLTRLQVLFLAHNQLSGFIPRELRNVADSDLPELGPLFPDAEGRMSPEDRRSVRSLPKRYPIVLNPQQIEAIEHFEGPLIILAGPGSGKTQVITHRVANLIKSGVAPWNILSATFTNKAANEMRARIENLAGRAAGKVNVGTFHSHALHILRRSIQYLDREPDFTIYDADNQLHLIKQIVRQQRVNTRGFSTLAIRDAISRAKDDLVDHDAYARNATGDFERTVAPIYPLYQRLLENSNGVDFGDMLFLCWQLFQEYPEVLAFYQDRFRFILVDEYQDINYAQYEFILELAADRGNLCVVGDDDQNVYSWRGASVRYIREFESQFPDAVVVRLERNYRSTESILACANAVISKLADRVEKTLWTKRKDGKRPAIIEASDEEDEARQVASLIRDLHSEGVLYRDIAVVYRVNAQSLPFEATFRRLDLPYRLVKAKGFYDRTEVRIVLAFLRSVTNVRDSVSFEQIAATSSLGLTAGMLQRFCRRATQRGSAPGELARALAAEESGSPEILELGRLLGHLDTLADALPVSQLIDAVIRESGYDKVLNNDPYRSEERWENVRELRNAAARFESPKLSPRQNLERFLSEAALMANEDNPPNGAESVSLLTAHASKGLEFGVVIVVGLENGVFPDFRSYNDPEQSAGERRLAYVAFTRAKNQLFLSYAHSRSGRDAPRQFCSLFLLDIPGRLLRYRRSLAARQSTDASGTPSARASPIAAQNSSSKPMNGQNLTSTLLSTMTDRIALVALYDATNGTSWSNNENWLSYAPFDEWYGVTADIDGRITGLHLHSNRLRGEIPAALGDLVKLTELDLRGNELRGTISREVTKLESLTSLHLARNQLSGRIPHDLRAVPNNDLVDLGLPFD